MKYALHNYSIKKLTICSMPLSVGNGIDNDIILILSVSPKFLVKLFNV